MPNWSSLTCGDIEKIDMAEISSGDKRDREKADLVNEIRRIAPLLRALKDTDVNSSKYDLRPCLPIVTPFSQSLMDKNKFISFARDHMKCTNSQIAELEVDYEIVFRFVRDMLSSP